MKFLEKKDDYLIWIIAPYLETQDPNLQYYYDYTLNIEEYTRVFAEIGCEWRWKNVTIGSVSEDIREIQAQTAKTNIVINLCDGDEVNGVPGRSVIGLLEANGLIYTGADDYFYGVTTSKIPMKEAFEQHRVPTPAWKVIKSTVGLNGKLFREIGGTLIVKPAISAGSMGLGLKNVVSTEQELQSILRDMEAGYHGWKVDSGGIFAEQFVAGREFTTLIVGSSTMPEGIKCYEPAERVFNKRLPEKERFLSFDRLWLLFDKEQPLPEDENLYEYYPVSEDLTKQLKKISIDAFKAVGGTGYGRLDIRMDADGKLYVLEVNAQCGLSEDENQTSIGAILRFAKKSFTYLTIEIIDDALMRHETRAKLRVV